MISGGGLSVSLNRPIKTGVGKSARGENMEKGNEWIERKVNCENCENGKVRAHRVGKSGRRYRVSVICTICDGEGEKVIWVPKMCEVPDCMNNVEYKCSGVYCQGNGWVCESHWIEENVGFSPTGYACPFCWAEIGSSGH